MPKYIIKYYGKEYKIQLNLRYDWLNRVSKYRYWDFHNHLTSRPVDEVSDQISTLFYSRDVYRIEPD